MRLTGCQTLADIVMRRYSRRFLERFKFGRGCPLGQGYVHAVTPRFGGVPRFVYAAASRP